MSDPKSLVIGLLVHEDFERVQALIEFFQSAQVRVVVHVDKNSEVLASRLADAYTESERVIIISTHHCYWGEWSLVEAELEIYRTVVAEFSDCGHVHFMSAADVPLKSAAQILQCLQENHDCDFVELVDITQHRFMIEGPQIDRIVYRYPFNFLTQRTLFEVSTGLQKILRAKRPLPEGLSPHMGGQFKTLRLSTIAILLDCIDHNPAWEKFFAQSWIPDECFLPTLIASLHSQGKLQGKLKPSLTYRVFNELGTPVVIEPEHLSGLSRSGFLFARKYRSDADLDFDYLSSDDEDSVVPRSRISQGDSNNILLLVWDSAFDPGHLEQARKRHAGTRFFGALDTEYDADQDQYLEWSGSRVSKAELEIWRAFRATAPASYLSELLRMSPGGITLTMNIDSVRKYGWEEMLKDSKITLLMFPDFAPDYRFDMLDSWHKIGA